MALAEDGSLWSFGMAASKVLARPGYVVGQHPAPERVITFVNGDAQPKVLDLFGGMGHHVGAVVEIP